MRCMQCACADTRVIESREISDGDSIRRRRECTLCSQRFTTYERLERPPLMIIKNDNTRQSFVRDKLLAGLHKACEKTQVTSTQIDKIVAHIENQLYDIGGNEVPSSRIGQLIMEQLAIVDDVAYVRFASVYRRFSSLAGFENELTEIRQRKGVVSKKDK